ncbi:hypothetical protein DFJ73DRAFT_923105 [Zopfochytrium polystomum]|nr:hypothetical protein DFJ73DRAFT_923105 [Zopfochytrium polystomum]
MAVHVLARLLPVAALAAASLFFAEVTAPAGVVAQGTTTGSNATDPCAALAASNSYTKGDSPTPSVVSGADLFACYNSFSVPAAAKKAQIDGVKAYFEFYPYLDLIASSSSPLYASNLDLFAALDAIAADNTVTTEFALHSAIADVVSSLNDAHSYYASLCFASGRMMQPYILDAKYKVGSPPTIYIRNTIVNGSTLWQQTGGTPSTANILAGLQKAVATFFDQAVPDYTKYVGYTVSKINGIDAVTYIQQHA